MTPFVNPKIVHISIHATREIQSRLDLHQKKHGSEGGILCVTRSLGGGILDKEEGTLKEFGPRLAFAIYKKKDVPSEFLDERFSSMVAFSLMRHPEESLSRIFLDIVNGKISVNYVVDES